MEDLLNVTDRTSKGIDGNVNKLKPAVAACLEMRSPYPVRLERFKRGNFFPVAAPNLIAISCIHASTFFAPPKEKGSRFLLLQGERQKSTADGAPLFN
jgi:hypothetical protein